MFIRGSIYGPSDIKVFPLEGLQFTMNSDLVLNDGTTIFCNSDIFLELECSYYSNKCTSEILFCAKCQSFTIDGEYSDYHPSGEVIYDIIKNSSLSEVILNNNYTDIKDKFKLVDSLEFDIGGYTLHKKPNNAIIC